MIFIDLERVPHMLEHQGRICSGF